MLNLVIPMAGRGKRFADAGYTDPKPFVDVMGVPMIHRVLDNMPRFSNLHLICLEEHEDRLNDVMVDWQLSRPTTEMLHYSSTNIFIHPIDGITEGAACTVALGLEDINPEEEVIVANSDQWIDWSSNHFLDYIRREDADGAVPTFHATHPKWSFAHVLESGLITGVVEKIPVSHHATCGVYYFRQCGHLLHAIDAMISKGIQTNGEYYLAPVYNELIIEGHKIVNYPVAKMYGLGTPEDLQETLLSGIFGTDSVRLD